MTVMKKLKNYLLKLIPKDTEGRRCVLPKRNILMVRASMQPGQRVKRRLGTAKGRICIREDFDEPLDDFKAYT